MTAYDAESGQKLWKRNGTALQTLGSTLLLRDVKEDTAGERCEFVRGLALSSSKEIWKVDTSVAPDQEVGCSYLELEAADIAQRYTVVTIGDESIAFDTVSGKRQKWVGSAEEAADEYVDSVSGYVYAPYTSDLAATVFDPATGRVIFSIPAAQAESLELNVVEFEDGRLYVETSSERLIIDVATGESEKTDWDVYPMSHFDKWVTYSDGTLHPRA